MERYIKLSDGVPPREVILAKALPCINAGNCTFCDYWKDNTTNREEINHINSRELEKVTGEFGCLQVTNSASIFNSPKQTLEMLFNKSVAAGIKTLMVESHWNLRRLVPKFRKQYEDVGINLLFMLGIETFNDEIREGILHKNAHKFNVEEAKSIFDGVFLLFGVKGSSLDNALNDIEIAKNNFKYAHVNQYQRRSAQLIESDKVDISIIEKAVPEHFELNYSPDDRGFGS